MTATDIVMVAGGSDDGSAESSLDLKPRGFVKRHPLVSLLVVVAVGYLAFKGAIIFLVH